MLTALDAPTIDVLPSTARTLARGEARSAAAIQLESIGSIAALEALGAEWNEVFARAGRPTQVFQTHAFAMLWATAYLAPHTDAAGSSAPPTGCRLAVITVRTAGRIVMIWPLMLQRTHGLRVLSWLGTPVVQYGDILIDPNAAGRDTIDQAFARSWAHIRAELRPDIIRLRKVRSDAAITPYLARIGAVETGREDAPFVTLSAGGSGSFEERQSGKARKNRRRLMRRLEEQGTVTFERHAGSAEAGAIAREALAIKRRWLGDRGLYSAAFADPRLDRFFDLAATDATAGTGCTAYALSLDGRRIGVVLGFACAHRMTLHVIGYDLDVERSGAGVLAMEAVLRDCESRGFSHVDLLAPKAEYKLDWADDSTAVIDHAVPVTLTGRALVRLYDGCLRRKAKSIMARLPLTLRRRIAGLCGGDATT